MAPASAQSIREVSSDRSASALIVEELRRQVDHQLTAAAGTDTKAAGLIAATFALVALVIPRVHLDSPGKIVATAVTFAFALATLVLLMQAIRPRVKRFSYGPDAQGLVAFADGPADELERQMVDVFAKAKDDNEDTLTEKANSFIWGCGR